MSTATEYHVYGPPGTGKTSDLAGQVGKWATEVGSDALMVASFTRAAATEIGSRNLPLSKRQIGTLHSFAYQSLDGDIEIANSKIDEWNDTHPTYRLSTSEKPDLDEMAPSEAAGSTEADALLASLEMHRARQTPRALWEPSIVGFERTWSDWKRDNDYLDFTDLLERALTDTTTAPNNPEIGLFDEAQDFTRLELSLVRHWGASMERILLAGDDDQCVYGFKGANPDALLLPPLPSERKRVLSQSYRVPRAVHAVATHLVEHLSHREPKVYRPRDADGSVRYLPSATFRVPELMVQEVQGHVEAGQSVMILVTCGYMLDTIKKLLRRDGVAFHNPYRRKRGDWNPLGVSTARRHTASDRLLAFLRTQPDVWGDEARWYSGDDVFLWADPLARKGLFALGAKKRLDEMHHLAAEVDLSRFDALFDASDPDRLARNLKAVEWADLDWYGDHVSATKRKGFEFPLTIARKHGGAALRAEPSVVIGTIHSVKGAEADVVYLCPDLGIRSAQQLASRATAARDATIRQFYVGMTRAREHLVITGAANGPYALDPLALSQGVLAHAG